MQASPGLKARTPRALGGDGETGGVGETGDRRDDGAFGDVAKVVDCEVDVEAATRLATTCWVSREVDTGGEFLLVGWRAADRGCGAVPLGPD